MIEYTFGMFVDQKRRELQLSARQLSIRMGVTAVYICDIQKGKKAAPSNELLHKMCNILELEGADKDLYYDLAAKSKNAVSQDLPDYIMGNEIVRTALRTAKEYDVEDKEWEAFIQRISEKGRDAG